MQPVFRLLAFSFLVLLISACGSGTSGDVLTTVNDDPNALPTGDLPAGQFRGLFIFGQDVSVFKDCATNEKMWLKDLTGKCERHYGQFELQPFQPVLVTIEATVTDSPDPAKTGKFEKVVTVTKLVRIDRLNGRDCPR